MHSIHVSIGGRAAALSAAGHGPLSPPGFDARKSFAANALVCMRAGVNDHHARASRDSGRVQQ